MISIDRKTFALLVACAASHVDDVQTGIRDGHYVASENTDLTAKEEALAAAVALLGQPESSSDGCVVTFASEQTTQEEGGSSPTGEATLYSDKSSGGLVQVLGASTGQCVDFAPQGGGFVRTLAREAFERQFEPVERPGYVLSSVTAEWLPRGLLIPAYTNRLRWNGWAMPRFRYEEATRLLEFMPDLRFDSAKDAFFTEPSGEGEECYVFPAETLEIDGSPIKTYAIGAGCWCWESSES